MGLEPTPGNPDMNLNHARMPIPPQLHITIKCDFVIITLRPKKFNIKLWSNHCIKGHSSLIVDFYNIVPRNHSSTVFCTCYKNYFILLFYYANHKEKILFPFFKFSIVYLSRLAKIILYFYLYCCIIFQKA